MKKSTTGTEEMERSLSEFSFRDIVRRLPVATYICNTEGYIIYYNKAAAALWGREPEPGKDRWCGSWKMYRTDGSPLPPDKCPMAVALKEGREVKGWEIVIERPGGERSNILPHPEPFFDAEGRLAGAFNMLVDITPLGKAKSVLEDEINDRKNALKESEQRYYRMIDEVQDYAILMLSTEGEIQNWNKGVEKIKGYTAKEIIGRNFRVFYTPKDQEEKLPERLLREAHTMGRATHEGWRVRKDGTVFWGSVVITALHANDNRVIGFSKVTRDLTEKKLADDVLKEQARLLAQKNKEMEKMNQELSSFVYVSSHDLQEPLRKIQTFASYILSYEADRLSEKGRDYFNRLNGTAARMKDLIHDLLVYSRTTNMDEIHLEPSDLEVFLKGACEELKEIIEEKNAVVESGPLPRLPVIPYQFQQLFTNIINNALKYAKKTVAPHIVIQADIVQGSAIASKVALPEGLYHHISFADNGIGFSPANNEKIFEIFQRLHTREEYSGTGIGLSICKKILENHHGVITAEGVQGEGAVIHVYMPFSERITVANPLSGQ